MKRRRRTIKTIAVIVGLDLTGDALIKLPFLRALRAGFPAAEISWLTAQGPTAYAGVLREAARPYLDHIWEQPAWLPTAARPRPDGQAPHFDLVIDTRGRWREAWRARLVPHDLLIAPALRYLLSGRRPARFWRKPVHIHDRLLELVQLAAGYRPEVSGGIAAPDAACAKAAAILPPGAHYIGLAPGAGNSAKIWPRKKFIELAAIQVQAGCVPVFLLGPQEAGWLPELRRAVPEALFPLQHPVWGQNPSLDATLAAGELLACAVANDSGTSHMLAAVDCPLVSLFGPTSALKLAPRVSRSRIVAAQQFGRSDMDAIPVANVAQAVAEILAQAIPSWNRSGDSMKDVNPEISACQSTMSC